MKPVQPSAAADADIDRVFEYYRLQGGHALVERFVDAYDAALNHVAQHLGTGSSRHARKLHINNLRFWPLTRFPYSVFYVEHADHIDVLRVLHQSSDLPRHLT